MNSSRVTAFPTPSNLFLETVAVLMLIDHTAPIQSDNNNQSTFCIEIKPKWGFLPCSSAISPETSIKKTVCRYCMHQQLKLKFGESKKWKITAVASIFCVQEDLSLETVRWWFCVLSVLVSSLSGFCPLDLYSGVPARVSNAVLELIKVILSFEFPL